MTLDLAQFHDTFFTESFEALDSMENALLKLSAGDADFELINTIFRVAHSIRAAPRPSASARSLPSRTPSRHCSTSCVAASGARCGAGRHLLLRSGDLMRAMLVATQQAPGQRRVAAFAPRSNSSLCTPGDSPTTTRGGAAGAARSRRRRYSFARGLAAAGASISSPDPNYCVPWQ
jgi:two-component system chemotaxis sensor kinase CheA